VPKLDQVHLPEAELPEAIAQIGQGGRVRRQGETRGHAGRFEADALERCVTAAALAGNDNPADQPPPAIFCERRAGGLSRRPADRL
jgi:hypothetical protein